MLLDANSSGLLVIDVQEKLTPLVEKPTKLINKCAKLIDMARDFDVPVLMSEQYPRGLGATVPAIKQGLCDEETLEKVAFSCVSDAPLMARIEQWQRPQIVLCGIESHVCVLQTACELKMRNKQVYVVVDAISARDKLDHSIALERMQAMGIHLLTQEMVFFEWMRQAGTPRFKVLSQKYLK